MTPPDDRPEDRSATAVQCFRASLQLGELFLPRLRRALTDLVDADATVAGTEIERALEDPGTADHVRHELLGSHHLSLVPPTVAARGYATWADGGERSARDRHNTLLSLRRHCGPDAWLDVPLAELATMPPGQLEALVSMHLGATSHETFTTLWDDWDGTLGELIDAARRLPRRAT